MRLLKASFRKETSFVINGTASWATVQTNVHKSYSSSVL